MSSENQEDINFDVNSDSENDIVFENDSESVVNSPRRSSRSRYLPVCYGNPVTYNSSRSLPGENDTTDPWWPGYPRGSYSSN